MKKNKKIIFFVAFIALCVTLYFITSIYAKYLTNANGNTSINISRWNILVNNISIRDSTDLSAAIVPVFTGNDNIASDIIAPSAEGYFDLAFDFTNTDVSFKYEITIQDNSESSIQDLITTGYSIDNGSVVSFNKATDKIEQTIKHSDNINNRTIRIFIKWDDSDTASMDNQADTLATTTNKPALMNVHIRLTQVTDA